MKLLRAIGRVLRQLGRFDDGPKPGQVVLTIYNTGGPVKPETIEAIQAAASRNFNVRQAIAESTLARKSHAETQPALEEYIEIISKGARCKVCKRLLVHHDSIERGAGRVCAKKLAAAGAQPETL